MQSHGGGPAFLDADDPPAKQAILRAALTLFVRDGVDETSIRAIADATGYTNPALFRHFAGKEALALHLFTRIFEHSRAALPPIDRRPFRAQLRATLAAYLGLMEANAEAALYLNENLRRFWPALLPATRRHSFIAHMRRLLAVGRAQRVIDRSLDQTLLIAAILGLLGQFARLLYFREIAGPPTEWLGRIEVLVLRMAQKERKDAER